MQIIDAAVADLADCQDGSWVFGKERTWMVFPYSLPEIMGIANYDPSISELINRSTPTKPLFPDDMESYLEELKKLW